MEAKEQSLQGMMMRYVIFLLLTSSAAFGQSILEGVVVDKETGKPVPFASIGIVGTAQGTSTNMEGQFSIAVPETFILKITCVGYSSATVNTKGDALSIQLKPAVMELSTLVITDKEVQPKKVLRKAFAAMGANYSKSPFLQQFFYRHYCKDDNVNGRLIEAYVDVWKNNGYRSTQSHAGEHEAIKVIQLRRSLDKTTAAQGHEAIAVTQVLQADVMAYQMPVNADHLRLHSDVSNLKIDFENYTFSYNGTTYYDDRQVYEIGYSYKKDSMLTTSGKYLPCAEVHGSLFVTTDTHAIVKAEDVKTEGENSIKTSVYYRKYNDWYYPYHLIREGENRFANGGTHTFHVEMMSVEINDQQQYKFAGRLQNAKELLEIPYDSAFWSSHTFLKTTPLENTIISDLGGGASLSKQFLRYREYEINIHDGGVDGEKKFEWLREDSKGERILYLFFWSGNFQSYLKEVELAKHLQLRYRKNLTFVFLSLDDDNEQWKSTVDKYSLFADGIINYRIGSQSAIAKLLKVKDVPTFMLLSRDGEIVQVKSPSDPLLIGELNQLAAK